MMNEMTQMLLIVLSAILACVVTRAAVAPLWRMREEEDELPRPAPTTKPEEPYSIFEETARWHGATVRDYVEPPQVIVHGFNPEVSVKPLHIVGWHNRSTFEVTSWN